MIHQTDRRRAKGSPDSPGAKALRELLRSRGPEALALHALVEPSTLRSHAEGHALPGYPFLDYYQAAGVLVDGRPTELRDFVERRCRESVELALPSLEAARREGVSARKTGSTARARGQRY